MNDELTVDEIINWAKAMAEEGDAEIEKARIMPLVAEIERLRNEINQWKRRSEILEAQDNNVLGLYDAIEKQLQAEIAIANKENCRRCNSNSWERIYGCNEKIYRCSKCGYLKIIKFDSGY